VGELKTKEFRKIEFKNNGLGGMPALRIECPVCHAPSGYACVFPDSRIRFKSTTFHYLRTQAAPIQVTSRDCIKNRLEPKAKKYVPRDKELGRGRGIHEDGWISGNCTRLLHYKCFSLKCSCKCHKKA